MGIPRSTWTDDDGSTLVGSIINNAELQKIYDNIDAQQAWIDIAFNAANFTASGSMTWTVSSGNVNTNRYILLGKLLLWEFDISGSTVGGTPSTELRIALPVGTVGKTARFMTMVTDNGVLAGGETLVAAAGTTLRHFNGFAGTANWTASASEGVSGVVLISLT